MWGVRLAILLGLMSLGCTTNQDYTIQDHYDYIACLDDESWRKRLPEPSEDTFFIHLPCDVKRGGLVLMEFHDDGSVAVEVERE